MKLALFASVYDGAENVVTVREQNYEHALKLLKDSSTGPTMVLQSLAAAESVEASTGGKKTVPVGFIAWCLKERAGAGLAAAHNYAKSPKLLTQVQDSIFAADTTAKPWTPTSLGAFISGLTDLHGALKPLREWAREKFSGHSCGFGVWGLSMHLCALVEKRSLELEAEEKRARRAAAKKAKAEADRKAARMLGMS